jgi:hypothetical protein
LVGSSAARPPFTEHGLRGDTHKLAFCTEDKDANTDANPYGWQQM